MSRDDELEPILRPWMERNAPDAPPDLLLRVMREVDTMSERERTGGRSWLSLFSTSPATGWILAAAAVAVMAIAVGFFIANLPGTPSAGPGATPTPAVTSDPTTVVDPLIAGWNSGDGAQAGRYYSTGAEARFAIDSGDYTEAYLGQSTIAAEVASRASIGFTITRTGDVMRQGAFVAFPLIWESSTGNGEGVAILEVATNGLVTRHYVFGASTATPARQSVVLHAGSQAAFLDAELRTLNAHDGEANASQYAEGAEWRLGLGSGAWTEVYVGRDAIAATTEERAGIAFKVTRTGNMVSQGSFVLYPWTYTSSAGSGEGIVVFQLPDQGFLGITRQWVIGR
jgi:hypothetical protein